MNRTLKRLTRTKLLSLALVPLTLLLALNLTPHFSIEQKQSSDTSALEAKYAQLPLVFEPNRGQADGVVQYLVHHGQATTYFSGTDTVTSIGDEHVRMSLSGATAPVFFGTDELESKTNYFIGNDQSKWQSEIPNYQGILAENVYPGIDLKYYGTNSQLEHDFIVFPGADPKQITLNFSGQQDILLDGNGNLVFKLGNTDLTLQAPTSFQELNGGRKVVMSSFELTENKIVRIALGDYDATKSLVIDPVLVYSTYLGGTGDDVSFDISVDANSNVYVAGRTASTNFPTSSPFQASNAGGSSDVFVTKFNPTGSALVYSTYLGGSAADEARGITSDLSGNCYIVGNTFSTNFPTSSAFQATFGGSAVDAFLTKLNPTGSVLTYSTYLGGSGNEIGGFHGVTVDPTGAAYVLGSTTSTDFPTASPFQAANSGSSDMFITKFNPTGSALVYSTYLGGSADDLSGLGGGISLDSSGNAYIVGATASTNFPTVSPMQASNGGGADDAFIVKLNAAGSTLIYSTYYGGSGLDQATGIVLDSSNNAYVSGATTSTNLPTTSPYQASHAGGTNDAFIVKLNAAGTARVYATYLGGTGSDQANAITIDPSNNVYMAGDTSSTNFPVSSAYQTTLNGSADIFVTKLNAAGSALSYSTYLGGSGSSEITRSITYSLSGNIYVAGTTDSTNFPIASAYQSSLSGVRDAFVTQLTEHTVVVSGTINPALTFSIGSTTCNMGVFSATQTKFCTHTLSAGSNAANGYIISYIPTTTLTSGANTIAAMASQTASVLGSEQFGFNLKANTAAGSFTAGNFGADPSGGTGTAMTGYDTANMFKFAVGGGNIAQTTGASNPTTFTASFIANITAISEAGFYSTPVTYNIVATY